MNLRISKKVASDPDRYSQQQRYHAATRLFRRASTFKDGEAGFMALMLKPQGSFRDDQLALRFEVFQMQIEAGEQPVFHGGEVVVPPPNNKPVYRKDGQVHNFNATPYPNKKLEFGNITDEDNGWWEFGEMRHERPYTLKQYQVRTGGVDRGKKPRRLKRKDFGLD